jgi:serine protease Do
LKASKNMIFMPKIRRPFVLLVVATGLLLATTGCSLPPLSKPAPAGTFTEHSPTTSGLSSVSSLPSIADVVAAVYPMVVTITTQSTSNTKFLESQTLTGAGSGWIYRQDGIIVTNNHVIEGAEKVTVGLSDGQTFKAESIHRDPLTDLAIIKINATGLPVGRIGDSSRLRVGDWVVAIGNPLGQGLRAKEGTISGLRVSVGISPRESLNELIEISAAINPGNSGGPLVNMAGEVIGITSAKIATAGVEGMGYAIAPQTALPIVEQLINKGYVVRSSLGAEFLTLDRFIVAISHLTVNKGAVITAIASNSPAEIAGLKVRDVIVKFQGKEVATAEVLIRSISSYEIGQEVEITFVRDGETMTVHAQLAESRPH